MKTLLALFFVSFWSLPGLPAQHGAEAWTIQAAGPPVSVAEVAARGYPALPASALVSAGARLSYARGGEVVARFGAREVRFRAGSAGLVVDGRPRMMDAEVYEERGIVYLPVEFFAAHLAEASGGMIAVDAGARTLRGDVEAMRAAARSAPPTTTVDAAPPVAPAASASTAPPTRRLVVIDAGHGGRDPGAVGPSGTREKDITLQMARRVAEILSQDPTLEVRLTRTRDTLIALRDRARFANQWRGEGQPAVFMSIHCNAHPSRAQQGFETYFLSEARTDDARRVQAMEDAAMEYEEQPRGGSALDFIMNDLRNTQYLRESSDWAQMIQDRLREVHPGPNRGVKQAGFAVLVGAVMPSVLVELGFISNRVEEGMLRDPRHQEVLARQLAEGVQDFFRAADRRQTAAR